MSTYDLTAQLMKNDYFLDVNPRNLRRLINVITLTGRLLRAYHVEFNWNVLASWVYLVEQWPYRSSWIVMCYEENETEFSDETTLQEIYEIISNRVQSINSETLAGLDRNGRKFELFLENFHPPLNVLTLRKFLPCTCNLDPYLIKLIRESLDERNVENLNKRVSIPSIGLNRIDSLHETGAYFNKSNYSTVNTAKDLLVLDESVQINMQQYNLNEMNINDVIDILSSIDGLNRKFIDVYSEAIKEKNIIGKVLSCCDLDELKVELNMTFGDWQLFKNWIQKQRYLQIIKHNKEKIHNSSSNSKLFQLSKQLQKTNINNNSRIEIQEKTKIPEVFSKLFAKNEDNSVDYSNGSKYPMLMKNMKSTNNNNAEVKKVDFFLSNIDSNQTTVSNINCLFENIKSSKDESSNEFIPNIKDEKNSLLNKKNGSNSTNSDSIVETNPLLENF
jgi:hypothetical protein